MGMPTTATTLATAFVSPLQSAKNSLQSRALFSPNSMTTCTKTFDFTTASSLIAHPMAVVDPSTTAAAIRFFQGSQLPAVFVAGASLAGLFAMTDGINNIRSMSKIQIFLLRLYHVTSVLSFCLSLSSLVTSASATTLLLLSDFAMVPQASMGIDAYQFLRSNLNFEFLFTRWSLLVSVPFLVVSATIRMLLQFELFRPKRRLAGWSVVSTMTGLVCFLMGYANTTQHCWPSVWGLTQETLLIFWRRAVVNRQPMFLGSLFSFGLGILLTLRFLMPSSVRHDQLADHDGYT